MVTNDVDRQSATSADCSVTAGCTQAYVQVIRLIRRFATGYWIGTCPGSAIGLNCYDQATEDAHTSSMGLSARHHDTPRDATFFLIDGES